MEKIGKYISLALAWGVVIYFCYFVIGVIALFITGEIANMP